MSSSEFDGFLAVVIAVNSDTDETRQRNEAVGKEFGLFPFLSIGIFSCVTPFFGRYNGPIDDLVHFM